MTMQATLVLFGQNIKLVIKLKTVMLISEQIGPKVGRPRAEDHWGQFQLGRIGLKTWLLWETPP